MQELTAVMFVYFVEIEGVYLHTVLFSRYKKKMFVCVALGLKIFLTLFGGWMLSKVGRVIPRTALFQFVLKLFCCQGNRKNKCYWATSIQQFKS